MSDGERQPVPYLELGGAAAPLDDTGSQWAAIIRPRRGVPLRPAPTGGAGRLGAALRQARDLRLTGLHAHLCEEPAGRVSRCAEGRCASGGKRGSSRSSGNFAGGGITPFRNMVRISPRPIGGKRSTTACPGMAGRSPYSAGPSAGSGNAALGGGGQKGWVTWERMERMFQRWIPPARVCQPASLPCQAGEARR